MIDASRMSVAKLRDFFEASLQKASSMDLMVSLHLKATMMKVRTSQTEEPSAWDPLPACSHPPTHHASPMMGPH